MKESYFTSESINEHVIRIVNPSMVYSYLVVGEKRAVLDHAVYCHESRRRSSPGSSSDFPVG